MDDRLVGLLFILGGVLVLLVAMALTFPLSLIPCAVGGFMMGRGIGLLLLNSKK